MHQVELHVFYFLPNLPLPLSRLPSPASPLLSQVDEAIRQFKLCLENNDLSSSEALRDSFEARIEELSDFYSYNDEDSRAILFEKQR